MGWNSPSTTIMILVTSLFTGLDSLDQLILNYNHISHLGPGMFSNMPKLTTLYIDHNQVRTIHPDAFTDLQGKLAPEKKSYKIEYIFYINRRHSSNGKAGAYKKNTIGPEFISRLRRVCLLV